MIGAASCRLGSHPAFAAASSLKVRCRKKTAATTYRSKAVICDRYHPQPMRAPLKACQLNRPDRRTTAVRTKQTFGFPLAPSLERLNHHPGGGVAAAKTKQQQPDRFLSSRHNDDTP